MILPVFPGWVKLVAGVVLLLALVAGIALVRAHVLELEGKVATEAQGRKDEKRRADENDAALRVSEQRRTAQAIENARLQKEADDAAKRSKESAAAAVAAADALQRLRQRAAAAAAGGGAAGGGAAAAGSGAAAEPAAVVLAEVLGRCGERLRQLAQFADESHDAAAACWGAWPVTPTGDPASTH
jgi:hypothetical protein